MVSISRSSHPTQGIEMQNIFEHEMILLYIDFRLLLLWTWSILYRYRGTKTATCKIIPGSLKVSGSLREPQIWRAIWSEDVSPMTSNYAVESHFSFPIFPIRFLKSSKFWTICSFLNKYGDVILSQVKRLAVSW